MSNTTKGRGTQRPVHVARIVASIFELVAPRPKTSVDANLWAEVAGSALAGHSRPARFSDGRLTVAVDHPSHLFALHLQRQQLLQRLQERLGSATVHRLEFSLASPP